MASGSTPRGVQREVRSQNSAGVTPPSSIPRIQFSSGMAKAWQDFSMEAFKVSRQAEDRLDDQAVAEATVEGATAGASGTFEAREYDTIRGRAFNQAGIETFITTMETRTILAMAEIAKKHGSNPAELKAAADAYHEGAAAEIDKVSPGAGALYRKNAATRTIPMVARAEDAAFQMTREAADAAIIENSAAIRAEVAVHAGDLFSDNPARSQAAANAIGMLGSQIMQVYNAVDPTTGKPLYSPTERAKAYKEFRERIFTDATMSWFDGQDDKGAAYQSFIEGDFQFEIDVTPADVPIIDKTGGKIRDKAITPKVRNRLSAAVVATDPSLSVILLSGGQDPKGIGAKRTGSTRHDHGNASDIVLVRDGKPVTPAQDPELYARFLENAASAGFTGIGHYPWGIHVGGGTVAAWGPDKTSKTLNTEFGLAIARGRRNPMGNVDGKQKVDMRTAISEEKMAELESQMRARITFSNTQADRADRLEQEELAETHDIGFTVLTNSYLNPDDPGSEPLSTQMINRMLKEDQISMAHARKALEWLKAEPPEASDRGTYQYLEQKIYNGEDVQEEIFSYRERLTRSDMSTLLQKNRSIAQTEDTMSEEERGYLSMIRQTVAPEGLLSQLDQGASMRAYNAQDEFRKRIAEGENPADVARNIVDRAQRETINREQARTQKLLVPRFATVDEFGRIDVRATAASLQAEKDAGNISLAAYARQRKLIVQWAEAQRELE